MDHYVGIDVSLEASSICVINGSGKVIQEAKIPSELEPLIVFLRSSGLQLTRIGLEAGPLSQWLYAGLKNEGFSVELLETRHVRDAFMP
jgi:transposase